MANESKGYVSEARDAIERADRILHDEKIRREERERIAQFIEEGLDKSTHPADIAEIIRKMNE